MTVEYCSFVQPCCGQNIPIIVYFKVVYQANENPLKILKK